MPPQDLNRRDILKTLAGMTAALMAPNLLAQEAVEPVSGRPTTQHMTMPKTRDRFGELLPQRKLGQCGAMVTMLGAGGAHIGNLEEGEAQRTIETAIAGGIRLFDTAAGYQGGGSELRFGRLLTPKYRDEIVLLSKSGASNAARARLELDGSLTRLKTDYLDIWQMHTLQSEANADLRVANGVLDVMLEAQAKGKVRYIGFSGHRLPESHIRMLQIGKQKGVQFNTCQMPVNVVDPGYRSFILKVLPMAIEQGCAVVAMKTLSDGGFFGRGASFTAPAPDGPPVTLVPGKLSVAEALHFVWSLPVSTVMSGVDNAAQLQEKIDLARSFRAMDEAQRTALIARVADSAGRNVETYKV